jgi:hypothetical protein
MGILKWLWGKPELSGSAGQHPASMFIEDIVEHLRQTPPPVPYCYMALFGDRPLSGKLGGDESIMIFTAEDKARAFVEGYSGYYRTTQPLTVFGLGSIYDLWAMLYNPSRDPTFKGPLGLIINFDYSGAPHSAYDSAYLRKIGIDGLRKGLSLLA